MAPRGSRPKPRIPSSSNTWRTGGGSVSGSSGSKSPTGARPKPSVPTHKPSPNMSTNATRKAVAHKSMPRPNHENLSSSRGKGYGTGYNVP